MAATGGSAESFDRAQLYHDCVNEDATAPPNVAGEFRRRVQIVETDVVLQIEDDESNVNFGTYVPGAGTTLMTTTTKVCIRLDSMPGSVKCYVRVVKTGTRGGATASTTETIGIYSDEMLHAVAPMADMTSGLVNPQKCYN